MASFVPDMEGNSIGPYISIPRRKVFELTIAVDQQTLSDGSPSAADLAHSQTWGSCDSDEKETLPVPQPNPHHAQLQYVFKGQLWVQR